LAALPKLGKLSSAFTQNHLNRALQHRKTQVRRQRMESPCPDIFRRSAR
jgi:hypothetical protein